MAFTFDLLRPYDIEQLDDHESGLRHYRTPDGTLYPSVTTVLSSLDKGEGLRSWIERVGATKAEQIKNQGARRGTTLHKAVEDYVGGLPHTKVSPLDTMFFKQIKLMLDKDLTVIRGIELPLYSKKLKTAGKTDMLGVFRGKMTILDHKTSISRKPEAWIKDYFLQTTAYAMMVYARYGIHVPQIAILMATEDLDPVCYVKQTKDYAEEVTSIFTNYKGA